MPYFVFRVRPFAQFEQLAEFDIFKDASQHAKALRANGDAVLPVKIKIMFAHSREQAEDLLCQIRDPGPSGDE